MHNNKILIELLVSL